MKSRTCAISEARRCPACSAACLRAGAGRLALALMLGLLVVPGFLAAPVLFAHLPTRAQAGEIAGVLFHIANRGELLLALAVALFWRGRAAGRWRWWPLLLLALLVGVNEFALSPMMADIKAEMGPIDAVPPDAPLRRRFGMLHGVSEALHLAATLAAAWLAALGWPGSGGARGKPEAPGG